MGCCCGGSGGGRRRRHPYLSRRCRRLVLGPGSPDSHRPPFSRRPCYPRCPIVLAVLIALAGFVAGDGGRRWWGGCPMIPLFVIPVVAFVCRSSLSSSINCDLKKEQLVN